MATRGLVLIHEWQALYKQRREKHPVTKCLPNSDPLILCIFSCLLKPFLH